jgi:hypothetical protein
MNTVKVFGVVLEGDNFKAYDLKILEGSGVYVNYVLQCTTPQINNIVRMLNEIKKVVE